MLELLNTNLSIFAGIVTLVGTVFTILKYTNQYQKENAIRNNLVILKEIFENTVSKLSSNNSSEKLSAAILLRRFFREDTELGVGGTPLANETINTIAAILRAEKTSDFQKLLADSLKYAPSLESGDFQKANLSNAVFGKKNLNLQRADFYRADLANTSFKLENFGKKDKNGNKFFDGVDLTGAQFYQANLQKTNFSGAELLDTNFYEANLDGAIFKKSKNIPKDIKENLDENSIYIVKPAQNKKVFISRPRVMTEEQEITYEYVLLQLKQNFELDVLEKIDDQVSSVLPKIKDKIFNSSAMVVFTFKQYHIKEGKFRWWDSDENQDISNQFLTTPWIYIEAGIATAFNKPMLVISDYTMNDGIFTNNSDESIFITNKDGTFNKYKFKTALEKWKLAI